MTPTDSGRVEDLFAAGARNGTPASVRSAACVLFWPVSCDPDTSERCASVLSDTELERADRCVTEEGRANFTHRRAFRRYCGARALGSPRPLAQIAFQETEKGRPYLPDSPDLWFSFSSSPLGFLGAWSSTHAIGVDLEDTSRNLDAVELARRFFSKAEAEAVEGTDGPSRRRTFFRLWSLKEAALKSIGEGLPVGLDAFAFDLDPIVRVVDAPREHGGPKRFGAHLIAAADGCAALVVRKRSTR